MQNFIYIIIVWSSTIISGLINYFYHPIMLKFLSINEFAEFESLISLFNIIWVLTTWLTLFLVKEISRNIKNMDKVKSIYLYSNKILLWIWFFLYLLFLSITPLLKQFLHFESIWPLITVWFSIVLTFQMTGINAVLQWTKKFNFLSLNWIIWAVLKLVCGLGFVYLWYKIYGAIWWFLLSVLILIFIDYIYIYQILKKFKSDGNFEEIKKDFKKDFKNIFHNFLLVFFISFFMNIDIIFAKHFFHGDMAGIYSGISVFARFLIFVGMAVETVYYPQIMEYKKLQVPKHFLKNSWVMMFLLGISAIVFVYFFWARALSIFDKSFSSYINLFLLLIVYCWIFVFFNFYSKLLIWWEDYRINYVLIIFTILLIASLYIWWNKDIYSFVYVFIANLFLLLLIILYFVRSNLLNNKK